MEPQTILLLLLAAAGLALIIYVIARDTTKEDEVKTDRASRMKDLVDDVVAEVEVDTEKLIDTENEPEEEKALSSTADEKTAKEDVQPLTDIKGIGPKTEERLLNKFGTTAEVYAAPEEKLRSVVRDDLVKKIKDVA